ncbi:hypothetical protein [Coraliomargarita parva]|uniref:hypothetical protein n=1 Tax=Coraliomargarita parva TaxID=3014050 RepID=UPI0022B584DB|nr:hypothetical protein [Coraliomargarita parva]
MLCVPLAINELERAAKQIVTSCQTREFRELSLQAEEDRFEVGSGTAWDVAQAQRCLCKPSECKIWN